MTHTTRLFFALEICSTLRETIASVIQHLKEKNTTQRIHWTVPENWHITICFLRAVPSEKIDLCLEQVGKSLRVSRPFEFTLGKVCLFPDKHPRMLVIQIPPSQTLMELQATVKDALIAGGFEQERRAFFPHITLGKFSGHFPFVLDEIIIPAAGQQVKEVVLFSSKTTSEGSIYSVVRRLVI